MTRADIDRILDILRQIDYKPGWAFRLTYLPTGRAATQVTVRNNAPDDVVLSMEHDDAYVGWLQAAYDGTGDYGTEPWTGAAQMISGSATTSEIVYTAFKLVRQAEEHETREVFKYHGVEVCGPHFGADAIVELVEKRQLGYDVRADAMEGARA